MSYFFHEELYRTEGALKKLKTFRMTVCGAGALGFNLIENLSRSGCHALRVIDQDRIEERNLSTQGYYKTDIGQYKAKMVGNSLFRALGIEVEARAETLTEGNADKLLKGSHLVFDTFDNSVSRKNVQSSCRRLNIPLLHAGLADGYAEVVWDDIYRLPSDAQDDICDYPLARHLAVMTAALAAECGIRYALDGEQQSYSFTLADFAIRPY